jgi:hypothetical protein
VFQPTLLLFAAGEQRVITMALMGKIRGMYLRDKKSISEIARLTSLSRNTIKRWLRTDFIREWRLAEGKTFSTNAFVPLTFGLGEAFQFDWSEEPLVVGGIYRRLQVSHLKLCASRAFWLVAYPSQGHEMLFDAHTRSFTALGGVPRRGIYDNMKTAVDKVKKGKGRTVNARFAVMCAHYLFDADFCNVASGWEKGVVEKNVQDSRRRIMAVLRVFRLS